MTVESSGAAPPGLVLASASPARRKLLEDAGLAAAVEPATIDEAEVKAAMRAEGAPPAEAAVALAELKAVRVSARHPGALAIGADQILECEGRWFDKPADMGEARAHIAALAGRRHELHTAVCVARDGAGLWHHRESPSLTMHPLSPEDIDRYLAEAGESVLASVGAYRLEDRGRALFAHVGGDFFTILGLPLRPLLAFLAEHGIRPA